MIGYIKPTRRPPMYNNHNTNNNNFNTFQDTYSSSSSTTSNRPQRPQRPQILDFVPNYETNHVSLPSVFSGDTNVHHQIYDENGYPVNTVNAIFNRPLYADRPDPVFQEKPIYARPTKKPSNNNNNIQTTLFDVGNSVYSNDAGSDRSTQFFSNF